MGEKKVIHIEDIRDTASPEAAFLHALEQLDDCFPMLAQRKHEILLLKSRFIMESIQSAVAGPGLLGSRL